MFFSASHSVNGDIKMTKAKILKATVHSGGWVPASKQTETNLFAGMMILI